MFAASRELEVRVEGNAFEVAQYPIAGWRIIGAVVELIQSAVEGNFGPQDIKSFGSDLAGHCEDVEIGVMVVRVAVEQIFEDHEADLGRNDEKGASATGFASL